jgi:hypothetical protein
MVTCTARDLHEIIRDIEYAMVSAGLTTVAYISDGASDNRGLFAALGGHTAAEYLGAEDRQKLRDMGIDPEQFFVAGSVVEQRGKPRFFISDPPHM